MVADAGQRNRDTGEVAHSMPACALPIAKDIEQPQECGERTPWEINCAVTNLPAQKRSQAVGWVPEMLAEGKPYPCPCKGRWVEVWFSWEGMLG